MQEKENKLAYILGPVRKIDEEKRLIVADYARNLREEGYRVFDPIKDAPQEDPTGYNIVISELRWLRKMKRASYQGAEVKVPVFWSDDPPSEGSRVDMGMVLGLKLESELVHEWGDGWEKFYALAVNLQKYVETYIQPHRRTGDMIWHVDMGDNESERVKLGLYLALLSRSGGFRLDYFNLIGEDDPHKKSYPKVVSEIQRRQPANIPLW